MRKGLGLGKEGTSKQQAYLAHAALALPIIRHRIYEF
jgi:hypothetical protein